MCQKEVWPSPFLIYLKATKFELLSFFILLLRQSAPKIGRKSKASVLCQVTSLLTGVRSFYDLPNKGKRGDGGVGGSWGYGHFVDQQFVCSGRSRGRVCPPLPIRPDACLRLKFLHRQDCIWLFNWLIFSLMKHALHFASKLNSTDIQKCNLLILGTLLWCWQNLHNLCYLAGGVEGVGEK